MTSDSAWLTALGAGGSAIGDIMAGVTASKADKYNAKVALQNAKLATQNAALEGGIGEANYGMAGLKTQQEVGGIKAAQAGRGVDVNSGSAKAVQSSQAEMGMLNQANIRSNAARAAYGFEVQATGFQNQAALDKAKGSADIMGGISQAGAGLLKGAGTLAEYGGGPTGGDTPGVVIPPSSPINVSEAEAQAGTVDNSGMMSGDPSITQVNQSLFGL